MEIRINYNPDIYNPGELVAQLSEQHQAEMQVDTVASLAREAGGRAVEAVTNRAQALAWNLGHTVLR